MNDPGAARPAVLVALLAALTGGTGAVRAQDAASTGSHAADGAALYRNLCARCHGRKGEGQRPNHDAAPRLGGNFARLSVGDVTAQILRGGAYMPPFAALSDREIAAIATYVRTSFGNDLGPVSAAEVAPNR